MWYWGYGDLNLSRLKLHESVNNDIWLTRTEKSKKQYLHDHCTFKKATCLAMIDPKEKYYDILSYRTINSFWQKHSATAAAFKPWDCIEYVRSKTKAIRVSDNTLDPDNGILNIYLVSELNHMPKVDDHAGVNSKCCALCQCITGRQLHARLICCLMCNIHLYVNCFHVFHAKSIVKKMKKEVAKHENEKEK